MTATPRRLTAADETALRRLLEADPVQNVFARSELRLGGLRAGAWWGIDGDDGLRAMLIGGPLVVPWIPRLEDAAALADALTAQAPPRMLVGPRDQVEALHRARWPVRTPREVRDPQPVMAVGRGEVRVSAAPQVRHGTSADLERLTVAAAAMHREEMGVDPLQLDPAGWRLRMAVLVERGWSYLWMERGEVVFKAELSAWTPEVAQIQGVYTAPEHRGRGVATAALAAVCVEVLRETPLCSLYVNHFNTPALAVYRAIGFRHVADFATIMY